MSMSTTQMMMVMPIPVLTFTVYGEAAPRGSKIVGHTRGGRTFVRDSSKRSYPWMDDVAQAAGIAMMEQHGRLFDEALRLELDFYKPRPKVHFGAKGLKKSAPDRPITAPDASKLARGTTDAMQGIVYRNDAQIVEEEHRKYFGEPARCEVRLYVLPPSV